MTLKVNSKTSSETTRSPLDILTIIAIAVTVWAFSNASHEILGHGGVAVLLGYKPISISTSFFMYDTSGDTFWGAKAVAGGATVVNLLIALISLLLLRSQKIKSPRTNYFLWLLMSVNLFYSGSNLIGWFIGPTLDWAMFLNGLEPLFLWTLGVTAVGVLILVSGFHLSCKYWVPFLGDEESERRRRMTVLTLIPYLTIIVVKVSAGFMNPDPDKMLIFWGSFGVSAFFLVWINFLRFWPFTKQTASSQKAAVLGRSIPWLVIGFVALLLFVGVLGSEIQLGN